MLCSIFSDDAPRMMVFGTWFWQIIKNERYCNLYEEDHSMLMTAITFSHAITLGELPRTGHPHPPASLVHRKTDRTGSSPVLATKHDEDEGHGVQLTYENGTSLSKP
jgi:hypothetical protein